MTERGKRYNEGKRRWSLIDHRVLEPLVDVMAKGAEKYGDKNYQLGMPIVEIMDSLQRHLVEFRDHGNDHDEESKMHHCAHILSNAYILMYNVLFHPDMDNRVGNIYSDSAVEDLKAWMKKNNIKNPVEFIKTELPELIEARGQEYVDEKFKDKESGEKLSNWSPEVVEDIKSNIRLFGAQRVRDSMPDSIWDDFIRERGRPFVYDLFGQSDPEGGILKGISPEQFLKQESQNARVRRNS